jgi:hypothetical protein
MKNRTTNRKQGRPKGGTFDEYRGNRLLSELTKFCKKDSPSAFSWSIYGDASKESSFRQWIDGAQISNDALARMHKAGVDVMFILTGERATGQSEHACRHGKLCEFLPMLLDNLAELVRQSCGETLGEKAAGQAALAGIADALSKLAPAQEQTTEKLREMA